MKKIIILALLIFFLSVGCVSASDNQTDSDFTGNFQELQDLIDNANENDTISLESNYRGSGEISISKSLTINGGGHSIDASKSSRIFNVGKYVTLNNITFTNGNADMDNGGAIYATSALMIKDCTFNSNNAYDGGAVYCDDSLTVERSFFNQNTAYSGGAVSSRYINSTNNVFMLNSANHGGAIFAGSADIDICYFSNNAASEFASAIYGNFNISVTNSDFKGRGNIDFIDYFNEKASGSGLYLKNNKMTGPNTYDIWYDAIDPITSEINLKFAVSKAMKGDTIEIASLEDDNGNSIRMDNILLNVYLDDKEVDTEILNYDNGYSYTCNLSKGTYRLTGSVLNKQASNVKVLDGQLVIRDPNSIIIDAANLTKYFGNPERFAVTVSNGDGVRLANKSVKITINGQNYTRITDENGQASMAINLNSGTYPADVECEGEKTASMITIKSTIVGKDITKMYKNQTQYYAVCCDSNGTLLKNEDISFNINGVYYTRKTNEEGVVRLNINLNPDTYIITGLNPKTNELSSNNVTVLSNIAENHDLTKYYRNDSQYVIRLLDDVGNPVGAGVNVTFNINGVFYTRTSNSTGHVKLNINLNPDTYIITVDYNGLFNSNTVEVLPTLEAEDLKMKYRDGSKFKVKVLDGKGNPFPNQNVKFNINGVFYDRTSDDNGIARLNINLMAGEYIITSMYNGLSISNKITISS